MSRILFPLILSVLFQFPALAGTDIESRSVATDKFTDIVVFAWGMGWEERETIETRIVETLKIEGVYARRSMDYTGIENDINKALEKVTALKAQGILYIGFGRSSQSSSVYIPGAVTGQAYNYGNSTMYSFQQYPGITIPQRSVSWTASLYNLEGDLVWDAKLFSFGGKSYNGFAKQVAKKVPKQLLKDGVI